MSSDTFRYVSRAEASTICCLFQSSCYDVQDSDWPTQTYNLEVLMLGLWLRYVLKYMEWLK